MATIGVSEKDFEAVADGARALLEKGERDAAYLLDDMAAKINSALSGEFAWNVAGPLARSGKKKRRNYKDVETPLQMLGLRDKAG